MPSLEKLAQAYRDKPVQILLINIREQRDGVAAFMHQNNYTNRVLLDSDGRVSRLYQAYSIPTAVIIDKNGRIILSSTGYQDWDTKEMYKLFDTLANL